MDDFGMCKLNDHIQAIDQKIVVVGRHRKNPVNCGLVKAHKKTILVEENVCPSFCELGGELRKL
jgi:hypothetical protein